MKSSFYGHCEKHNSDLTRIELEHGKTIDICDECEKEKQKLMRAVFLKNEPNETQGSDMGRGSLWGICGDRII
jgi:phage anti-repressor protein